ncbi:AAA family ATPase [Caminibacter sp.]
MVEIINEIEKIIKGKTTQIKLILSAFFSKNHVLLTDIPGVGKTTIAKTIAKVLGLEFNRIQFTSDMLPSDIIGVNYYNGKDFVFKKGPIFSEFILADEINRASPKTQSALLEAMQERQVSVDGVKYSLPEYFFVIATQNPDEIGTYELPLSELDRFAISLSIGYPNREAERLILKRSGIPEIATFKEKTLKYLKEFEKIYVDEKIYDLILDIAQIARAKGVFSTRAALSLLDVSKGWALVNEREYVIDDDVFSVLEYVLKHRIKADFDEFKKLF